MWKLITLENFAVDNNIEVVTPWEWYDRIFVCHTGMLFFRKCKIMEMCWILHLMSTDFEWRTENDGVCDVLTCAGGCDISSISFIVSMCSYRLLESLFHNSSFCLICNPGSNVDRGRPPGFLRVIKPSANWAILSLEALWCSVLCYWWTER